MSPVTGLPRTALSDTANAGEPGYPRYNRGAGEGLRPFEPWKTRAPVDCAGGGSPRPPVAAHPDGVGARTVMVGIRVTGTEFATGRAEPGTPGRWPVPSPVSPGSPVACRTRQVPCADADLRQAPLAAVALGVGALGHDPGRLVELPARAPSEATIDDFTALRIGKACRDACNDRRMLVLVAIPACPVHFGGRRTGNRRSAGHGPGRRCLWRAYGCATADGAPMPIRAPRTWLGVTPVIGIPRSASGRMEPDSPILSAAAGSLPASDPVREGQTANRDGHVGSIAQAVARAGGTTLASGGERVLRRFEAAPADPSQQGTTWTPIRVSGWMVGVVAYSGTLLEPYDSTASRAASVPHPVFWTSGRLKHQAALLLNFSRARAGVMYPCRWRIQPLL